MAGTASTTLNTSIVFCISSGVPVVIRACSSPAPLPFDAAQLDLRPNGRRYLHAVRDGWLVGINHGEFGAALWWISRDARSQREVKVPRELKQGARPGRDNPRRFRRLRRRHVPHATCARNRPRPPAGIPPPEAAAVQ